MKRNLPVMFDLGLDVLDHSADLSLAHAEGPVTGMPFELLLSGNMLADPGVRDPFEFLHPIRQGNRSSEAGQDVDVVLDSTDSNDGTPKSIAYLAKVDVEFLSQSDIMKRGLAVLCGEHQMHTHR